MRENSNIILLIMSLIFSLASCAENEVQQDVLIESVNHSCHSSNEYLYKAKNSNLVHAFDLDKFWFGYQGIGYSSCLEPRNDHFSGDIKLVENEGYIGMRTPFSMVLPRQFSLQISWVIDVGYEKIFCNTSIPYKRGVDLEIKCEGSRHSGGITTFSYNSDKGITK